MATEANKGSNKKVFSPLTSRRSKFSGYIRNLEAIGKEIANVN